MIKRIIIASMLLVNASMFGQEQGPSILAVRFHGDEKNRQGADALYTALCREPGDTRRYSIKKDDAAIPVPLPEGLDDSQALKKIAGAGTAAGASHVILGRVYSYPDGTAAEVYLVATEGTKTVYKTGCAISGTDYQAAARILSGRIDLYLKKTAVPALKECRAGRGESNDKTAVTWEESDTTREYAVYRSSSEQGPFLLLGTVAGSSYDDTAGEPGLQYWYGIGPVVESVPCGPGKPAPGYRKLEQPKGRDLNGLIKEKTRPVPVYRDQKNREKDAARTAFLKGYYKNPVELSIVLNIIKSYVKKGSITVLNGFRQYDMDIEKREITMVDEQYRYAVIFTSSRLVRIFFESQMKNSEAENKKELTDILVQNMIAFCVYRNEITITDAEKRIRIVPCYDAVGVATELHRNYSGWKKTTMVFGTGNKELEEKIKQARKKEGH